MAKITGIEGIDRTGRGTALALYKVVLVWRRHRRFFGADAYPRQHSIGRKAADLESTAAWMRGIG